MRASELGIMGGTGSSLSYDDVISSGNARWAAVGLDCRADTPPLALGRSAKGARSELLHVYADDPTAYSFLWVVAVDKLESSLCPVREPAARQPLHKCPLVLM